MAKKVTGVPKKIPKNPKKIEKMARGPTEPRVIALKRVKKCTENVKKGSKKGQK